MSKVTAFHKAGHVVAAILCGEFVYAARVTNGRPVEDRRGRKVLALGLAETSLCASLPEGIRSTLAVGPPAVRRSLRRRAIAVVLVDGAGAAAEARASRTSLLAVWLSSSVAGDLKSSMAALEPFIGDERRRSMTVSRIWEYAAKLVCRGAGWRAVEAVATAILAGVEDGGELREIVLKHVPAPDRPVWFVPEARSAAA